MKKIEAQMCAAVKAVALNTISAWHSGNTAVSSSDDGVEVRLHGNLIAKFRVLTYTTKIVSWQWSLAGWNTNTTRSRINALVGTFSGAGVTTRKGQPCAQWVEFGRVVKRLPIKTDEWVWCAPREPTGCASSREQSRI